MVRCNLRHLVLACLAGVPCAASADILISNLPGNDATQSAALEGGRIKAMGFTIPSGDDYLLTSVTVRLDVTNLGAMPLVRIFDNVGSLPTNQLAVLDVPPITSTGIADYVCTPSTPFTLEAGRTYWLVVWNSGTASIHWKASSPIQLPTGIASHFGSLFSTNTGPNPPASNSSIINSYQIDGQVAGCRGDLSGSSDPNSPDYGVPDGQIDSSDFFYFLDQFAAGNLSVADLSGSTDPNDPGYGVPDGQLDASDFFFYLDLFVAGCP
ncbi:MAG: hypothetical protein KF866_10365 [Phycisphaeraceae bacterium]|nr:hypothetical protein [Phycisphaeraceae bacterium]MCW5754905.1 hypothetical protein [Phycisphaeraceae bacterium]